MVFFIWFEKKKRKGHAIYRGKLQDLLTMFVAVGDIVIQNVKKETQLETQEALEFLIDSLRDGLGTLREENDDTTD